MTPLFSILSLFCGLCLAYEQNIKNVLLTGLGPGSHLRNQFELAEALSQEHDFNVTFLTSNDFKENYSPQNDRFHFIRLPNVKEQDCEALLHEMNDDALGWTQAWYDVLKAKIVDNKELMEELKNRSFDLFLQETTLADYSLLNELKLNQANVMMLLYGSSPDIQVNQRSPMQLSQTTAIFSPALINKHFALQSLPQRIFNIIIMTVIEQIKPFGDVYKYHPILFGSGIYPISDPVQVPQSFELIYPMSKLSSKFNDKFTKSVLPYEYEKFLQEHQKNVLIAFGTTFQPSINDMTKLIEFIRDPSFKDIGFVVGLKRTESTEPIYEMIQAMPSADNLMIRDFVPQKLLLNDERVKMFVTHCGANSVHEAFYYNGTPLYGLPQSVDQFSICKKFDHFELGICGDIESPHAQMVAEFQQLLEDDNKYAANSKSKRDIMGFEELRGGKSFVELLRYAEKFGNRHLYHYSALTRKAGYVQMYDLDIIFGFFTLCYLAFKLTK